MEDWRGFYKRRLAKLDAKALDIIQTNSHLIHDDDSRKILRAFLKEGEFYVELTAQEKPVLASRQEYATEIWREGDKWDTKHDYDEKDWVPENNNYKFTDHERLCIHIREVHRYLYAVRQEIDKVC